MRTCAKKLAGDKRENTPARYLSLLLAMLLFFQFPGMEPEICRAQTPGEMYDEYRVLPGDSLYAIARGYDITHKELMQINQLSSSIIYKDQLLKVPWVTEETDTADSMHRERDPSRSAYDRTRVDDGRHLSPIYQPSSAPLDLDLRDVDLRDVLTALGYKLGATVIYTGQPGDVQVTLKAQNVEAEKALGLIVQSMGLSYIRKGNLIVVGTKADLGEHFFHEMLITRFDTYFITASEARRLIAELDVPVATVMSQGDAFAFWAQGTAAGMQKVREILFAVDHAGSSRSLDYRVISPTQINPQRMLEILEQAGIRLESVILLRNQIIVFDQEHIPNWSRIDQLAREFDSQDAREASIFAMKLDNISVDEAKNGLETALEIFGHAGGQVQIISDCAQDQLRREIVVVCPAYFENEVRDIIRSLDSTRANIRAPLYRGTHEDCARYRDVLSRLTGVPAGSMQINRLEDDYVLWVEANPGGVKRLQDMKGRLDNL